MVGGAQERFRLIFMAREASGIAGVARMDCARRGLGCAAPSQQDAERDARQVSAIHTYFESVRLLGLMRLAGTIPSPSRIE